MNPRERGFLLLTCGFGDPQRRPLSMAQLRLLSQRAAAAERTVEDRDLCEEDLIAMGYGMETARRIVRLLGDEDLLEHTLRRGEKLGCRPVSRVNPAYPVILRRRLGLDSPGCLWVKGDPAILSRPAVSLVGSREPNPDNACFAREVGRQAAQQGIVLVSGNARGVDRIGQEACLDAGGQVISIVADALCDHPARDRVLYVSEGAFDSPFSSQRALSRNRCIHAMGRLSFVAQCSYGKGGTWNGTLQNLRHGWSPVICFRDGSSAMEELEQLGAYQVNQDEIADFAALQSMEISFLE